MTTTLTTDSLRIDRDGALAIVTLTQAARGNPFDGVFCRDFKQAAAHLFDARDLRAVLLRAEGANFSFGGDIKTFHPVREQLSPLVREWTADLHMGLQRFWRLPVPVVSAVQGFAMGGGVALMAGADLVLAGQSARFGSAFAQLGFSCDSGTSFVLTARMGMARARRFLLMTEILTSQEAVAAGLADRVLPDEALQDMALATARQLAAGPTMAYGELKRLFLKAGQATLEAQLEDEALTMARVCMTADAHEGLAAMVEKRKPVFQGR